MKKISLDEFTAYLKMNEARYKLVLNSERADHNAAVNRARAIFINSGITDNISIAFAMYNELLAERDRDLVMRSEWTIRGKPRSVMDRYQRPKCPECGADMLFRVPRQNGNGIKTQLVCGSDQCDVVLNSEMAIQDWMNVLEKKDEI